MKARRVWLKFKAWAWTALAFSLIVTAVLVGVGRLAFPFVERYQPELEGWLSAQTGRDVHIGALAGRWTASGPALRLSDVVVDDRIRVPQAALRLDFYAWARPGDQPWTLIEVDAAEITVSRSATGELDVEGLGERASAGARGGDLPLGLFVINAEKLRLTDEASATVLELVDAHGRLHITPGAIRLAVNVAGNAGQVRAVAEMDRGSDGVRDGRIYVQTEQTPVAVVSGLLPGDWAGSKDGFVDLRVWSRWSDRVLVDGQLDGELSFAGEALGPPDRLAMQARYERTGDGWVVGVDRLSADFAAQSWATSGSVRRSSDGEVRWRVDALKLDMLEPLLSHVGAGQSSIAALLRRFQPTGVVADLTGATAWPVEAHRFRVSGQLEDVSTVADGPIPGLTRVNGAFHHRGLTGAAAPTSQDGRLIWPWLMANPVSLGMAEANVTWSRTDETWSVAVDDVVIDRDDIYLDGRLELSFDGARPSIDAAARIRRGELRAALEAVPVRGVPGAVHAWMDQAVRAGEMTDGGLVVRGDLDEWPFAGREGLFEVFATVRDTRLVYWPGWPALDDVVGDLTLRGDRLSASISAGRSLDVPLTGGTAEITRIGKAPLTVRGQSDADARHLLAWLRRTPAAGALQPWLDRLTVAGESVTQVELTVPFEAGSEVSLEGATSLRGAAVTLSEPVALALDEVRGGLRYTRDGFVGNDLQGVFRGNPATLALEVGALTERDDQLMLARLNGPVDLGALVTDLDFDVPWRDRIVGASPWTFVLEVPADPGSAPSLLALSSLQGTRIDLPAPAAKTAAAKRSATARLALGDQVGNYQIQLEGVGALRYRGGEGRIASGAVGLGDARRGLDLPDAGWRIRGDTEAVDIDGWVKLIAALPDAPGGPGLESLRLQAQSIRALGRDFDGHTLAVDPTDSGFQVVVTDGATRGTLSLPAQMEASQTIDAQFERLVLPSAPEDAEPQEYDAADLPVIHLYAESAQLWGAEVGSFRLETFPAARGLRVDQFETRSPQMRIQASGDWTGSMTGGRSRFDINVTGEDLGWMLRNFGFEGMVEGGQTVLDLKANWPGLPGAFELGTLSGKLDLFVGGGQFLDVDPGAGRFFGLLSVQSVPRRLILDFSDVFKSGLTFDSIRGTFDLDAGQAYTQDLRVEAPAADILVRGRTGLAEKDYDQRVVVIPKVGETLPILGALAGLGPAAAAALLVAQGVFSEQIDQMTQVQYRVTGSWDDPQVERLAVPAAAASESPAEDATRG